MKKKALLIIMIFMLAISSLKVFAPCGEEGEAACSSTDYAVSGDYTKITDWNQVDFSQIPDQSVIPEAYINKIPADKIDISQVKNLEMLTSSQLAYGNNLEQVSSLNNLDQQALSEALAQKYGAQGLLVDLKDGGAKISDGVILTSSGQRISMDQLKNCESVSSLSDGSLVVQPKESESAKIISADGTQFTLSGGYATVGGDVDDSSVKLSSGASFGYDDQGSKITLTNKGGEDLPITIGDEEGAGVSIKGNTITVEGAHDFKLSITGDSAYILVSGNEKFTIDSDFNGEYSESLLWTSSDVSMRGDSCTGPGSLIGNAIIDATGMAVGGGFCVMYVSCNNDAEKFAEGQIKKDDNENILAGTFKMGDSDVRLTQVFNKKEEITQKITSQGSLLEQMGGGRSKIIDDATNPNYNVIAYSSLKTEDGRDVPGFEIVTKGNSIMGVVYSVIQTQTLPLTSDKKVTKYAFVRTDDPAGFANRNIQLYQ